jgi:hypothetical protein
MTWGLARCAIDVELGPDGALDVLEYEKAFGSAAANSMLSRIEYRVGAPRPAAEKADRGASTLV